MFKDKVTMTIGELKSILNEYKDSDIIVLKSGGFEEDHWAELYILDKNKVWYILDTEYD